jgi:hypothetical protein
VAVTTAEDKLWPGTPLGLTEAISGSTPSLAHENNP